MRVRVLLFSSYADALGASSLDIDLAPGVLVSDLVGRVRELAGAQALPPVMVAINQSYASPNDTVNPGDEVALIPPVAGG